MKRTLILALFPAIVCSCSTTPETTSATAVGEGTASIERPFTDVDVPVRRRAVVAEQGDTLYYGSGAIVVFPQNAFVDKEGNPINGKVDVEFKEYRDAVDFLVSGIPMGYDSAGMNFEFQSAGMCDLRAFQNGTAVYVNPKALPEINLLSSSNETADNLYVFDLKSKSWIFKGAPERLEIKKSEEKSSIEEGQAEVAKYEEFSDGEWDEAFPVEKMNSKFPVFEIEIESPILADYIAYKGLKFQVIPADVPNYKESDADVEWRDIRIERTDMSGVFKLTFFKGERTATYRVRPVLEGKDYDTALAEFEKAEAKKRKGVAEANAAIEEEARSVRVEEARARDLEVSISEGKSRVGRLRSLIAGRDASVDRQEEELRKEIAELEKIREKQRKKAEDQDKKLIKQGQVGTVIYRNFQVTEFGLWNCDRPYPADWTNFQASFRSTGNEVLNINRVFLKNNERNGLASSITAPLTIDLKRTAEIWAVVDGKLAYIKQPELSAMNIKKETKSADFVLTIHPEKITSAEQIRDIIGL